MNSDNKKPKVNKALFKKMNRLEKNSEGDNYVEFVKYLYQTVFGIRIGSTIETIHMLGDEWRLDKSTVVNITLLVPEGDRKEFNLSVETNDGLYHSLVFKNNGSIVWGLDEKIKVVKY